MADVKRHFPRMLQGGRTAEGGKNGHAVRLGRCRLNGTRLLLLRQPPAAMLQKRDGEEKSRRKGNEQRRHTRHSCGENAVRHLLHGYRLLLLGRTLRIELPVERLLRETEGPSRRMREGRPPHCAAQAEKRSLSWSTLFKRVDLMADQAGIDARRALTIAPQRLFVDGQWVTARDGNELPTVSLIDGRQLKTLPMPVRQTSIAPLPPCAVPSNAATGRSARDGSHRQTLRGWWWAGSGECFASTRL
jgi:hypothetical protein